MKGVSHNARIKFQMNNDDSVLRSNFQDPNRVGLAFDFPVEVPVQSPNLIDIACGSGLSSIRPPSAGGSHYVGTEVDCEDSPLHVSLPFEWRSGAATRLYK